MYNDLQGFHVHTTAHYVFHFRPGSITTQELLHIAQTQESCYANITDTLQVAPEFPLHYVLLESREEVGQMYERFCGLNIGAINGFACFPDTVVAVYNSEVKCIGAHEDTHLIAHLIDDPYETFLVEGLAMYMDAVWWNEPNERWVNRFISDGRYISPFKLLDNDIFYTVPSELSYPIAGAFVRYLVEMLTIPVFLEHIYAAEADADAAIRQLLGKALPDVETDFLAWVSKKN